MDNLDITHPPKFKIGDRVKTRSRVGTIHSMGRNRVFPEIWTYYVICDDYPTRMWFEQKELRLLEKDKPSELSRKRKIIWENDMAFNFRTGGFLKASKSERNSNWIKYVYIPEMEDDNDLDIDRRNISNQVSEYFYNAQNEFFKPLKRESKITNYLSRTEFEHGGVIRNLPYFWANGKVIVRQGTTLDRKRILSILDQACEEAQAIIEMQYLRAYLNRGLMIVVTDYKNIIKGLQTITTEPGILSTADLLYVTPDCRGLGAFGMIYEMIFGAAEFADYDRIYTRCADGNPVADKYEYLGFTQRKEKGKFEFNGVDIDVLSFDYEVIKEGYATFF